jgi:acyl carrier protein
VTTRDKIRAFISETFFVEDFKDDDSFLRTGIIDSTGMLELVTFLERELRVKVGDDELIPKNMDSLSNICAFIERKSAPR